MKITSQHVIILFFVSGVFGDEVKKVMVMEGDSVTLDPSVTEKRILWRFGSDLIAEISEDKISYRSGPDGRFRDRLRLDSETGSLTITNMKMKHSSLYKLEAIGSSGTTYKRFNVSVYESPSAITVEAEMKGESVTTGESFTLQTDVLQPRDQLIVWRFGDEGKLIAKADLEGNNSLHEDIDEGFSDRLKLNNQDGSLTITQFRKTDSGLYIVKISSNKQTLHKKFSVTVIDTGLSPGVITGIAVAGFFVVVVLLLLVICFVMGIVCWRFSTLKRQISPISKKLLKISKELTYLPKTSQQLSEISEKLEKLPNFSEKYLSEDNKSELSKICDQLRKLIMIFWELKKMADDCGNDMSDDCGNDMSDDCAKDLSEDSKELTKRLEEIISEILSDDCAKDLSEINKELKKLFEGTICEKLSEISTQLSKISGKLNQLLSVNEGETARLETGVENRENVKIFWRFGKSLLAEAKEGADPIIHENVLRGRFKGRLELDKETGSLSINNTNTGDCGEYNVSIKSSKKQKTLLMFTVSVSDSTENVVNESVNKGMPFLTEEQQSSV